MAFGPHESPLDSMIKANALMRKKEIGARHEKLMSITQLEEAKLSPYEPYIMGNDDPLKISQSDRMTKHFVLIGTALLRSVHLACSLAAQDDIPEVVIVDNSSKVAESWSIIKQFFADLPEDADWSLLNSENQADFLTRPNAAEWRQFLGKYKISIGKRHSILGAFIFQSLICDGPARSALEGKSVEVYSTFGQEVYTHFASINFKIVRETIATVFLLRQSWGDKETFAKLAQIYQSIPIVTYSSNIIEFVHKDPNLQIQVLQCMDLLKPTLSFCTNYDKKEKKPTKMYCFRETAGFEIAKTMDLCDDVCSSLASLSLSKTSSLAAGETKSPKSESAEESKSPRSESARKFKSPKSESNVKKDVDEEEQLRKTQT